MTDQQRESVEIQRLIEETRKFVAEQHKLMTERDKLRIDRWLTPLIIICGGLGSFTAAWAAVRALLHVITP